MTDSLRFWGLWQETQVGLISVCRDLREGRSRELEAAGGLHWRDQNIDGGVGDYVPVRALQPHERCGMSQDCINETVLAADSLRFFWGLWQVAQVGLILDLSRLEKGAQPRA